MKGGDGRVGQAKVQLLGPVPGDGLVGANGVVLDPALLGPVGESDGVGDLVDEECSYSKVPKPRSRDPFCPGVRNLVRTWASSGWLAMKASNRNERNGPPLSVTRGGDFYLATSGDFFYNTTRRHSSAAMKTPVSIETTAALRPEAAA